MTVREQLGSAHKIRDVHLQRLAYIYIRQSSPKQVAQHLESQQLQYQLTQRAEMLGWHPDRIRIVDADQGQSGRGSHYRQGYQELVTQVSLGQVGIICGYQVSRLARNNRDWYHLLDLAAVFDTLIADSDGLYDLRLYNDRLLLGLKGTMSEAELHLMRQRLDAGRMNQVYRGAYRQHLPTGLVRLPEGMVVKDPDDQVRHTIELVFTKFEQLGSCPQVVRYLSQEQILLPRRQRAGWFKGELLWKRPSRDMIYDMIRNPAYAGAFAYGRKQVDYTRQIPGQPATGRLARPMGEWLHLQFDVYPAYLTWEQYLANQERLRQAATRYRDNLSRAQGTARTGRALLQGLATCGHCGRAMRVSYKQHPHYYCDARRARFAESNCLWVQGPRVETGVVQAFFEALQPAQLDVLEAALAEQQHEHQQLARQWSERLKRAEYDAHLARRQYDAVDPDNRLVAAELERRWEDQLRQVQETREAMARFRQRPVSPTLTPELRDQLQHISETLPDLWSSLDNAQKKALLRSLIARVICKRETPGHIEVRIVWVSGHYTVRHVYPPVSHRRDAHCYPEMVAQIEKLWQNGLSDEQIAEQLTAEGFHSARRPDVRPVTVQKIRLENGWHSTLAQSRNALELNGYLTIRGLAAQLDLNRDYVYRWVYNQTIDPDYVTRDPQSGVYLIRNDLALIEQLRSRVQKKRH